MASIEEAQPSQKPRSPKAGRFAGPISRRMIGHRRDEGDAVIEHRCGPQPSVHEKDMRAGAPSAVTNPPKIIVERDDFPQRYEVCQWSQRPDKSDL